VTEAEFQQLLQRYLDNRCTPQERAAVERWYDHLEESEGLIVLSQNQEAIEDTIWQRLAPRLPSAASAAAVAQRPAAWWQAPQLRWAAALLLFALGIGWLWPVAQRALFSQNDVATAHGWTQQTNTTTAPRTLRLPDGSRVTLHPGSTLRYPIALAGPKREVYLIGEAYFQVSKNPTRPFLVLTNQVVTTVLGTSFRVKAPKGATRASVAVREGKVSVQARVGADLRATPTHPAAAGVVLLPNQQVVYSAATRVLKKELVDKPAILVPQAFSFEERPVTEVLAALQKAYGVDIVYERAKLAGCTISITFYDEPLFEKLGLLCKSLGASYSMNNEQIIIRSVGCRTK